MLDWQSIQATLYSLVQGDIEAFAIQHRYEQFYGFFLDCDSYYGDVFPNLNTYAFLRKQAETYKMNPDLYAKKTIADIEEKLRWSPGDWGYLQINRWDHWRTTWEPNRKSIEEVRGKDGSFGEQFLAMICRLLIQLEQSDVLNLLSLTSDFATMCADHDERLDDARIRLERIREQAKPTGHCT